MSNWPVPDPVETAFRDLRGALYTGDGRAAMAVIERRPDLDTLQSDLRPNVPVAPASPGHVDLHAVP